ncbi:MAG: 2-oxoacid:ferredoxin oxidoreductase subunit beta [Deltaproteobacteria bacterium]|nr:MAG: 2-oxoacid:ferredoxin oxidoreductase subunit beta [Deltaproteobacteria bacterium]
MTTAKELGTYAQNTWCPGCGNFGILNSIKKVLADFKEEGLDLNKLVLASGIGCHAKIVDYIKVNSFYSIHGRVPPPITGIKLANPELVVIGHAGDGDAYGEGIEHLIFSAKRNINVTFIVHNNRVYGLTTGQFTPTSPAGFKGRSTPGGSPEDPLNPIELMLSAGATFVARGFSGKPKHLQPLIKAAIKHQGFAFIDVLQPCFTFYNTYDLYNQKVYELTDKEHDSSDREAAFAKAGEWAYGEGERIPIGIFYQIKKPTYEEKILEGRIPVKLKPGNIRSILEKHI